MFLRNIFEAIQRTGQGKTAVIGWGRGMGHKGHMMLASSVITQANRAGGDPYFVVSKTVGKDDPITPDEKIAIYKKVFPQSGHIFQPATDEIPDLTRVLQNLNQQGYTSVTVVLGADQVKAFQYLKNYNNKPDKSGNIMYSFDNLDVISRQETGDPSAGEEGPRATPMRQVLMDPTKSEQEQFAVWRDAMSPEIGDDEVRDLMNKAKERMTAMSAPKPKKAKAVAEAFDNPYKSKWEKSEYGLRQDALVNLPDGTNLSIMFSHEDNNEWEVEFHRNNSQEVTGEGDAQRIFATVLNAMQKFIKKQNPSRLKFAASKETDPTIYYEPGEPQPNPASRAKLYDRLVQRYAKAWGYRAFRADNGHAVIYELSKIKQSPLGQGVAEAESKAMSTAASRLANKDDGKVAKLRAAGDKRRDDQLKGRNIAKRDATSKDEWGNLKELSNDTLGRYKKAAGADASAADKAGDYKRADKRFSGIVKATKKQFANDEKGQKEAMLPKSAFAGSDKNKLGPAAHAKGKQKGPVKQGQFVGGMEEEKQRLDPSCWKGYKKQGTKMKGDTRVNNCVKVSEGVEDIMDNLINKIIMNEAISNNRK